MDIYEFADMIEKSLVITRRPADKKFYCEFKNVSIKNDQGYFESMAGVGETPENALCDYISNIRGKKMIIGEKTEIKVPEILGI